MDHSDETKLDKNKINTKALKIANGKNPLPFDRNEHGHRFRRQTNKCQAKDTQHVLFLLDTSGSIGSKSFKNMTSTVANLTALFCKPIKVGVLTFNHEFNLEFCFNCFKTDYQGRFYAREAIRNIPYRRGRTHTAGAVRCVCDKILQPDCGLEFVDDTCIDVIVITDGWSNDPHRDICHEVECLHNHSLNVNTYSLGINNYDRSELGCIQDSSNSFSVFEYKSFDEFYASISNITDKLADESNEKYTCTYSDGELGEP